MSNMKRFVPLTTLLAAGAALPLAVQAQTHAAVHHASAGACARLPELSSRIPALPPGTPCARHLYTISIKPAADLEYVAPFASSADLRETLRLQEPTSFSLDYIDIHPGSGEAAAPHRWLTVKYSGYLTDGTRFDSSADHPDTPFSFEYGQIGGPHSAIPGWETGFAGMRIGARRRLIIPYQLAYGAQPRPKIPAKSMLIFDIELVAVSDRDPAPPKPPTASPQRPAPLGSPVIKPAPAPQSTTPTPPAPTTPATSPKP
jgi:peptidylprolyl isomerase